MEQPANRRILKTRTRAWPAAIARGLARSGLKPNHVSLASLLFAAIAGFAFVLAGAADATHPSAWLVAAAAGIQLRLLCNLLDGLMAVEGGLKSPTGELFNEVPDRIADVLILIGAGMCVAAYRWGFELGIAAALLAVFTAYVRLLGGSLGLAQDFRGPMAKQHRMFVLTLGALGAAAEHAFAGSTLTLLVALWVIVAGSAWTAARRLGGIARGLKAR